MKLIKIEPTPSPNNMKLVVSEHLPMGKSYALTPEKSMEAPDELLKNLLGVQGVKALYRVADFISLERHPKYEWEVILPKVRSLFGEDSLEEKRAEAGQSEHVFGEVRVFIQLLFDLPMQVKLEVDGEEIRVGLPQRFIEAVMKAQAASENVILDRKWVENYPRYGDIEAIKKDIVDELSAAYDQERLNELVERALHPSAKPERPYHKVTLDMLEDSDWKKRYAALDRMDPTLDDLPVLTKALEDEKVAIRRLAVVYLGLIGDQAVLPYLYKALKDKTVTVRRTAGDALSDIGDPQAIPAMIEALKDPSKIVRWRAAMFLYEVGDESALEALKAAKEDPEFEVALQIQMAIERIEGGQAAQGSVWKQMTDSRTKQ
ncbi:conserved virulence factor C family protein [Pullulanibacillus sp. KACC 23026]|uniref:conserved virulence factor C family protein n=1 Tax=Pullulanibacillus sp. KACC 23026 TaxID=3028315 RepID=UPI0023B1A099|nr:conserved virulence factor C family protein [Pullulanibacillus sp. KACC 23026]WEG12296.1 conserved virulence factor C family protein [Pullulanibacillus sp. KACC 23026]